MFFWNSLAFLMVQQMLAIWSLVPLPLLNPAWTSGSSFFTYCWSLAWRILSITLLVCEIDTTERKLNLRLKGDNFFKSTLNDIWRTWPDAISYLCLLALHRWNYVGAICIMPQLFFRAFGLCRLHFPMLLIFIWWFQYAFMSPWTCFLFV